MEFVPFGQDGIPPPAGKASKCRMLYNSLKRAFKRGIEAFNLLNFLPFVYFADAVNRVPTPGRHLSSVF